MDDLKKKIEELKAMIKEKGKALVSVKAASLSKVTLTPGECRTLCDKVDLKYHAGLEERVIAYRFTDTTLDHYNEVIIPKGVDLKTFKGNPVILGQHDSRSFPIGKSIKTFYNKEEDSVDGWALFFDDEIDKTGVSEDFFKMASNGGMTKGSIGFTASYDDIRKPSPEEREAYKMPKNSYIFDKIKLLEYSLVSIPANPNSGQITSRKGAYSEKTLDFLLKEGESQETIDALKDVKDVISSTVEIETGEKPLFKIFIPDGEDRNTKIEEAKAYMKDFQVELTMGQPEPIEKTVSRETEEFIKTTLSQINELKSKLEVILQSAEPQTEEPNEPEPIQKDLGEDEGEELYNLSEKTDKFKQKISEI